MNNEQAYILEKYEGLLSEKALERLLKIMREQLEEENQMREINMEKLVARAEILKKKSKKLNFSMHTYLLQ
ncbi:hypothetical protein [Leptobacterium sp. I13]|uniref:hypothetical protein n=1 Tax=Leptobacterium meishanense TaxID=3128904 RepID=UPI0030EBC79A